MAIGRFLTHRVSIIRNVVTLDEEDEPTLDEHGQPVTTNSTVASDVAVSIQPKSAREVAAISQSGVTVAGHTIYLLPTDVRTGDEIVHTATDCPMLTDLPDGRYQVTAVPSAAGIGHHLELDCQLIGTSQSAYAVPVGGGS